MAKHLILDGRTYEIADALSSGPGIPVHTYILKDRTEPIRVYQSLEGTWMKETYNGSIPCQLQEIGER